MELQEIIKKVLYNADNRVNNFERIHDYTFSLDKVNVPDSFVSELNVREIYNTELVNMILNYPKYELISVSYYVKSTLYNSFYASRKDELIIVITQIKYICKQCGRENHADLTNYQSIFDCIHFGSCCRKLNNAQHTNSEISFQHIKVQLENHPLLKGKYKIKDRYTIQCRNKHVVRIREYIRHGDIYNTEKITCWICDNEIEKKYEFFKVLKELGANYYIEEVFSRGNFPCKREYKKILNLVIYTYNDKKHLTGKIVFNDPISDHQAKANANKLVFKWFPIDRIEDREYCINFLGEFYNQIITKNKLK